MALLLSLYFTDIRIYILIALFLLTFSYKETLLYLICLSVSLSLSYFLYDLIPYGIVDHKSYNYYVVDKLFYKVALYSDKELMKGDIVSCSGFERCSELSFLKKNILFSGSEYISKYSFIPRNLIDSGLNRLTEESDSILNKILYNQYQDDEGLSFNIGYGLYSYYFLNRIRRKSIKACLICMILISIFFSFEVKFILLLFDCLFDKKEKIKIFSYKIIFICIYNYSLFYNYSILLPLLFSFTSIVNTGYDFRIILLFIESLFFKEIDLIETVFFSSLVNLKIFFYLFSILLLFIPNMEKVFLFFIKIFSMINSLSLPIRGSISFISLAIFLILNKSFRINRYVNIILLCLLILSPFNQPLLNVCFIDVGQGDATLIKYPLSRHCVLIDTGSSFNYHKLRKTLYSKGIYRIDYLIISHDDEDHNGNIENLYKDFKIGELIDKGKDFSFKDINYHYLYLGDFGNDNDNSLAYLVNIDGYGFLFTGDLSKKAENVIHQRYGPLDIDFLKVSHHGSYTGTSPYLIGNILPVYAIISTNGKYNHPSKETLETLDDYMVRYFITKESGNIDICFSWILDFIRTGNNDFVIINKK